MATGYEVRDRSILAPHLKRLVWSPVLSRVPEHVSANSLTLLGTACSAAAFAVTALGPATRTSSAVVAALFFAYLTLDNIDGAQARRTGTSSPLGEFLDHFLDAVNLSFLFMGSINTFRIPPDQAIAILLLAAASYTLTFWEQRVTGRLHMGMLGNVEGIATVVLFHLAAALLGPDLLIERELALGWTVIDFFWLSAILSTAATSLGPIARVRRRPGEVLAIAFPLLAIALWYRLGRPPWPLLAVLLMGLTPALAGRLLIAHVVPEERVVPDRGLPVLLGLGALGSVALHATLEAQALLLGAIAIYTAGLVALDFVRTVRRLSEHLRPGELLARMIPVDRT